jgi:hypothetical protein
MTITDHPVAYEELVEACIWKVHPAGISRRLLVALSLVSSVVAADPERGHTDPKRENPNYDGRGNQNAKAGSWALWIPRVALAPLYIINEYALRRPLGALTETAERKHWANSFSEIFSFGSHNDNVFAPTALFDLGVSPSVGAFYIADNLIVDRNAILAHGATWGPSWINATVLDRYTTAGGTSFGVRADFKRQADLLFLGTGPDTTTATRSRYGVQRLDVGPTFTRSLSGESSIAVFSGVRWLAYRPGDCCHDPSLDARIADGTLAVPDGYNTSYRTLYQRAQLVLDTRDERPVTAIGGFLAMHAETSFDVHNDRSWIEYGATAGVAVDLHGRQQTVIAQVAVEYADPLHGGVVPFNELPSLGGEQMPGFVAGWMTGRSALATQVAYSWPVWPMLVAHLRVSAGNAFGDRFDGLAANKLRLSSDFRLSAAGKRDQGFEILVGVGSETIEQGARITSVRLSVGSRRAF